MQAIMVYTVTLKRSYDKCSHDKCSYDKNIYLPVPSYPEGLAWLGAWETGK